MTELSNNFAKMTDCLNNILRLLVNLELRFVNVEARLGEVEFVLIPFKKPRSGP